MSERAGQVRLLAALLSQREHSRPVTARRTPGHGDGEAGVWVLSWVDGPDDDTLQDWARTLTREVPDLAGLDVDALWTERTDSPAAWAALLLAEAGPGPWRPARWRSATQLAAHVDDTLWSRAWLDEIEHPGDAAAVRALLAATGSKTTMARRVLAQWRALPPAAGDRDRRTRQTSRCEQCGALFLCKPGPAQRWCGPACRLRHWRAARPTPTADPVAVACPVCEQPVRAAGTGRPGRYCTPACRKLAHRHQDSDPAVRAAAYARRRVTRPPDDTPPPADTGDVSAPAAAWTRPRPRPVRPPLAPELAGCLYGGSTVHQLHVVVDGIDPPIWRRLQIPSAMPLIRVSDLLCTAFGWTGEHLHSFGLPDEGFGGVDPREFTLTLGEVAREPGWQLFYRYDFGDDWLLTGTVEKILTRPSPSIFYPRCTGGRRNGPAEDCGGPPGYHQLLAALRARKGGRYRQAREQHPGWRPEDFDRDTINQDLQRDYRHITRAAAGSPRPD